MLRPDVDRTLADALQAVMAGQSLPFDDTVPVLRTLQAHGIRTALLSNIGWDVRPRLREAGTAGDGAGG